MERRHDISYLYFDLRHHCENKQYLAFNHFLSKNLKDLLMECGFTALE